MKWACHLFFIKWWSRYVTLVSALFYPSIWFHFLGIVCKMCDKFLIWIIDGLKFSFDVIAVFKVSEYPFKQNKNMLKNKTVLLYTYFYNISLNVLRKCTFANEYNLPFLQFPNIGKIGVKVGPKTSYFSFFMSSCPNTITVFNNFFSLICSQPRDKQNRARDFLLFKYFLNNLLLTVFMQNTLSKLVELLQ